MRPTKVVYQSETRQLNLTFENGRHEMLSAEYLRVFSPSAEVRGHTPDQHVLQTGKKTVEISKIEPVGNYALRLVFSDGHDTGIYSWLYFDELINQQDENWTKYLQQLREANASRLPTIPVGTWTPQAP